MSDAPAEKSLAEIELEDNLRSIRGLGENADTVEHADDTAAVHDPDDRDGR